MQREPAEGVLTPDSKFLFLLAIFSAMLLPRIFRIIGWVLLLPALVLCLKVEFGNFVIQFFNYNGRTERVREFANGINNFTDEVSTTILIAALIFIAFGKLEHEDERSGKIRLQAFYSSAVVTWAATALYLPVTVLPKVFGIESRWLDFIYQLGGLVIIYNFLIPIMLSIPVFWYFRRRIKQPQQLKQVYLLPYMPFNTIGKACTILFLLFGIVSELFSTKYNLRSDMTVLFPIALALWTCSNERHENEESYLIRLKALQLSMLIHYVLFVIMYWLVYGWDYFDVLFCSIISMQLIFLIVFFWMKNKALKQAEQPSSIQPI